MSKRSRVASLIAASVILGSMMLMLARPGEPEHGGRLLSEWLRDLGNAAPRNAPERNASAEAIRRIGTNAIPLLLEYLQANEFSWKQRFIGFTRSTFSVNVPLPTAAERRQMALRAFEALGPLAEPAIPAFNNLVQGGDPPLAVNAMLALSGIGSEKSVPVFVALLGSGDVERRVAAANALGNLYAKAAPAVPELVVLARDPEPEARRAAVRALGMIEMQPQAAVPALAAALADPDERVRMSAAFSLGMLGTNAAPARPALEAAASVADGRGRFDAAQVLLKIRCQMRDGAIIRGPTDGRRLAIAFTGHEFSEGGEMILDQLSRHGAKASFFLTGDFLRLAAHDPLIDRMVAAGHQVGPHSDQHLLYCDWQDSHRTLVSFEEFQMDLDANLASLPRAVRAKGPVTHFLPPYEHYNRRISQWTRRHGLTLINYTPGTRSNADYTREADANFVSSQAILDSILKQEQADSNGLNGFILLLHLGAGPGRTDKFHPRFGELLDTLADRGYQFVRVDELLEPRISP